MFSRRALKPRLDALVPHLGAKAVADLAERIDRRGRGRLPAMWEAVWLHGFGELGPIGHEQPLPDGAKPDFCITVPVGDRTVDVIGDITCVSDRGLHDRNPVDLFWEQVVARIRSAKLDPNHFRYQIGHRTVGDWPNIRTVLTLPPRREMANFIKEEVVPFLRELANVRPTTARREFHSSEVQLTLAYDNRQEFGGGGYASYNHLTAKTDNPIYARLKAKEDQLRTAPEDALRVVILCDTGCQAMQKQMFNNNQSADKIAHAFLQQSSVIDIVLLVSVEVHAAMDLHKRHYAIEARITSAPAIEGTRRNQTSGAAVRAYLDRALKHLPLPVLDAHNAALRIDEPTPGRGTLGISMGSNRVRLSARVVLELLAGKISYEDFQRTYGWDTASECAQPNPFTYAVEHGQLFTAASVYVGGDADDDWLEFSFGKPDPAAAPFRTGTVDGVA